MIRVFTLTVLRAYCPYRREFVKGSNDTASWVFQGVNTILRRKSMESDSGREK